VDTVGTTDVSASPATTYHYRVRARGPTGASAYSNVATATTPPSSGSGGGGVGLPPAMLVERGSVWRYLDTGVTPSSSWKTVAFDDTAWRAGAARLGYGGDGEETKIRCTAAEVCDPAAPSKFITSYFRRTFEVGKPHLVQPAYREAGSG
jgi:hypothetical protein